MFLCNSCGKDWVEKLDKEQFPQAERICQILSYPPQEPSTIFDPKFVVDLFQDPEKGFDGLEIIWKLNENLEDLLTEKEKEDEKRVKKHFPRLTKHFPSE